MDLLPIFATHLICRGKLSVAAALLAFFLAPPLAAATSKVYLVNGETRVGFVNIRDGRVTTRAEDRLFQNPERAVHRIEHVTGDTSLAGKDNLLLREKPEKLSKTLVAIPKGCEVIILGHEADWVKIEVYSTESVARGYIRVEDLSDSVLLNPPSKPGIKFKNPPPSLREKYPDKPQEGGHFPEMIPWLNPATNKMEETPFGTFGDSVIKRGLEGLTKRREEMAAQAEHQSATHENVVPRPVNPGSR
jgi:hypothetical protein